MDHVAHFHREITAFRAAASRAAAMDEAPLVPSCPGWSVADLVVHLGGVHRGLTRVIEDRLPGLPDLGDLSFLRLPADLTGWPLPENAPNRGPIPRGLLEWFAEGAALLEESFRAHDPGTPAWTWSAERNVGFWARMQAIEAAVHRWDAENALGAAGPVDPEQAADAVTQTFQIMAPARRGWTQAPPGAGERYRFRRTDGSGVWTVRFDADDLHLSTSPPGTAEAGPATDGAGSDATAASATASATVGPDTDAGPVGVELAGTASDLMLYLWRRIPADRLEVRGDPRLLERYFVLVPPV
ncbi:maleylpyruvate isomerase N-terminal domain-containing protein [Nonomuraea rhodomycinica]|uniref:Maleylpyruvate isomerase N-terminal domain-containing protein n=1 Tax=Nonomuraea rhodomycinica TaxID=1712872 RepID=A0A7Y6M9W3_9ACTN|nr:maleylpyruvate isomerase N-terminal domain-containing protein [Nonomuraea rhodomycinica]NUW39031.1 maleylpyruvate isomerase N-terminal domain-containing protein [Nonomuraea rhodomycinica]